VAIYSMPPELRELKAGLQKLATEEESAWANRDYERAAQYKAERLALETEFAEKRDAWRQETGLDETVEAEDIAEVIATWTGIPVSNLLQSEAERLLGNPDPKGARENHHPARDPDAISDGSQLRLALSGEIGQLTGTVTSLDESTLTLLVDDSPRTVRRDWIESAEISRGRRSRFRKTLIGAGIGAVIGVSMGLNSGDDPEDQWFGMTENEKARIGGVVFGLLGAVIGAVLPPGENWQPTALDGLELSSRPVPGGGFGVAAGVSF